jgi:hypothetical protein
MLLGTRKERRRTPSKKWFAASENTALKNSKSIPASETIEEESPLGFVPRWVYFWFRPVHPVGLHTLRFLAGLLFASWFLTMAGNQTAFLGLGGWVDVESARRLAGESIQDANVPEAFRSGWSLFYLFDSSPAWVNTLYWSSIIIFVLFAVGLWTRITSVLTWLLVVSFVANPLTRLDAEPLLGVLAFYLMIGYLLLGQWNRRTSLHEQILGSNRTLFFGRGEQPPSVAANLAIRLLQVHIAIVVVVSALHKLQIGDWWAGVAFWYPLHPPFQMTRESLRAERAGASSTFFFLSLAQYLVLAWQLAFPFFAWRRSWRIVLLGGALIGWIGCIAIYKQPLFGPVYCIAVLSYLTPVEWLAICDKVKVAGSWVTGKEPAIVPTPARHGSRI